jgi:hypothetical protein
LLRQYSLVWIRASLHDHNVSIRLAPVTYLFRTVIQRLRSASWQARPPERHAHCTQHYRCAATRCYLRPLPGRERGRHIASLHSVRYGALPFLVLPVKVGRSSGSGQTLAVTNVLNRTYKATATGHSHGLPGSESTYLRLGGRRRALYESLHQFTILNCCHCCTNRNHGSSSTSRRQRPGANL